MSYVRCRFSLLLALALAPASTALGAVTVFEAAGPDAAAIQSTVDGFRTSLGANNGVGNPKTEGRREINWDGVPAQFLDPFPPNFFNANSPRGLELSTSGSRLKVSGDDGTPSFLLRDVTAREWGLVELAAFSPQKIFTTLASREITGVFFVPGTTTRAAVSGFGAIFVDVDAADTSRLEGYDARGNLIFSRNVPVSGTVPPPGRPSKGFSFVGVVVESGERIAFVRIVTGNAPMDSPWVEPEPDGVALDDFIYGEPLALASPPALGAWIGAATRGAGANSSRWRTDVGIFNPTQLTAAYTLRLFVGGNTFAKTGTLAPKAQLFIEDVVGDLNGGNDGTGPVEVASDLPIEVSWRVYNAIPAQAACFPGASFGMSGAGVPSDGTLGPGDVGFLPQLREDAVARTNIALSNTGSTPAQATVTLYDGSGAVIGSYDVTVPPKQISQERAFASKAGQTNLKNGSARVSMTVGSGLIAYATVIDNLTNDPSFVLAR